MAGDAKATEPEMVPVIETYDAAGNLTHVVNWNYVTDINRLEDDEGDHLHIEIHNSNVFNAHLEGGKSAIVGRHVSVESLIAKMAKGLRPKVRGAEGEEGEPSAPAAG